MILPTPAVLVTQVSFNCDKDLRDPDALLARYATMTGWAEAITAAGAVVTVVQSFPEALTLERNGVTYRFTANPETAVRQLTPAPDVVHVHGMIFSRRTWWLRRQLPTATALVLQNHGSLPPAGRDPFGLERRLQRAGLGAADGFLFAAEAQGDAWRNAGLIRQDQPVYAVMPASATFSPVAIASTRADAPVHGDPAILWVGRLNDNKDPLTVLDAFEQTIDALPGAVLTMVYGDDELLPAVHRRIEASATLRGRVHFAGRVPHAELPAFYAGADMFVVGSHYEGSGFSLIEAVACGASPVVTDIPSFRAITGDGDVGQLWPVGNAGACAAALVAVARRRSDTERARVKTHFERTLSWSAIGRRALAVYADVVARRSAAIRVLH